MTDPALRIACAEECGWKGPHHPLTLSKMEGWWSQNRGFWWLKPDGETLTSISDVPDYPNDLNSCAQFEATLTKREILDYQVQLHHVASESDSFDGGYASWHYIHASARQRCIAFLKVKGRWQPGGGEGARP